MKRPLILLSLLVVFTTLMPTLFAQQNDQAQAPRISLDDFKKLLNEGGAMILDVRGLDSYTAGHIPGAISMPLGDISNRWKELPKDKPIVTYCS